MTHRIRGPEYRFDSRAVSPGRALGLLAFYMSIGLVLGLLFTTNPFLLLMFALAWPIAILVAGIATVWLWIVIIVAVIAAIALAAMLFGD
jgi:hypothetical protein